MNRFKKLCCGQRLFYFIVARQMLEVSEICILKAEAPQIMKAIAKMQELDMGYVVTPFFKYS